MQTNAILNIPANGTNSADALLSLTSPDHNYGGDYYTRVYTYNSPRSNTVLMWKMPQASGTITKVVLGLYHFAAEGSGAINVSLYPLTGGFTESGVTWNKRNETANWMNAGGDYDPAAVDTVQVNTSSYGYYNWTLYGPGSERNMDLGWNRTIYMILESDTKKVSVPYFYSKEYSTNVPVLHIEYSQTAPTSTSTTSTTTSTTSSTSTVPTSSSTSTSTSTSSTSTSSTSTSSMPPTTSTTSSSSTSTTQTATTSTTTTSMTTTTTVPTTTSSTTTTTTTSASTTASTTTSTASTQPATTSTSSTTTTTSPSSKIVLAMPANSSNCVDSGISMAAATTKYGSYYYFNVYSYNEPRSRTVMSWKIPPLSGNISKVTLSLYHFVADGSGAINVTVHSLNGSFSEAAVTWNTRNESSNWASPGGDFDPSVIDTTAVNTGSYGYYNWTLYGPGSERNMDLGWNRTVDILLQSTTRKVSVPYFYSREAPGNIPVLYIEYTG